MRYSNAVDSLRQQHSKWHTIHASNHDINNKMQPWFPPTSPKHARSSSNPKCVNEQAHVMPNYELVFLPRSQWSCPTLNRMKFVIFVEKNIDIFLDAEIQEVWKELTSWRCEYAFTETYNSLVFLRVSFRWWVAIRDEMSARHARHSIQLCSLKSMSGIYECITERNKEHIWPKTLFFPGSVSFLSSLRHSHIVRLYSVMTGLWESAISYVFYTEQLKCVSDRDKDCDRGACG